MHIVVLWHSYLPAACKPHHSLQVISCTVVLNQQLNVILHSVGVWRLGIASPFAHFTSFVHHNWNNNSHAFAARIHVLIRSCLCMTGISNHVDRMVIHASSRISPALSLFFVCPQLFPFHDGCLPPWRQTASPTYVCIRNVVRLANVFICNSKKLAFPPMLLYNVL